MAKNKKGLMAILGADGVFREYNDEFDLTIHCESQEEQDRVIRKLNDYAIIHARWIYDESRYMVICSHCMGNPTEGTGHGLDISTLEEKYHYCRLCGAKMDEEAADESEQTEE